MFFLLQLVFLKLTALIFPTSDFRHSVTTPAFHLLLEALSTPVANLPIIHIGIGLCAIAYEVVLPHFIFRNILKKSNLFFSMSV